MTIEEHANEVHDKLVRTPARLACRVREYPEADTYLDIKISRTDGTILRRILDYEMESGPFSVYKIYSYFKKALRYPKSYKNTHQWIQKLYSLGMIEEVYGNYARGARFYRISTGGWLNLILDGIFRSTWYEKVLIKFYDQNIFFKTFILPYFEIDTVKTLKTGLGLDLYLIICCEATILWLEVLLIRPLTNLSGEHRNLALYILSSLSLSKPILSRSYPTYLYDM